jgi:predicted MFS family arabinose efflux permease
MTEDTSRPPLSVAPADVARDTAPPEDARLSWAPIVALAAGIAALVASEFLPAAVLPALAADVGVTEGTAGLAVAATAVAGALVAPSIAVLLPRTDRRTVLVALLLLAVVANVAVAIAPGFVVLLVGRLLLGAALAGYWAFAFAAGTRAVPGRPAAVSTSIAMGVTLATILAIPVASLAGDRIGWRGVFAAAAVLTAVSAVAVARTMPPVPPDPTAGLTMLRRALANRRLVAGVAFIGLVAFGNFTAYPYIRVAIEEVDADRTPLLLLAWGVGGLVGNLAAGRLARHLRPLVATAPLLFAASLLVVAGATNLGTLTVGLVLWGLAFSMVPVATQLWVTRVEPERAESALALQVTAFQVAIAAGSTSGGALLDHYGVTSALLVGAAAAVVAGVGFALVRLPRS